MSATGNFSNGGVDTFDLAKRWIGIRLQQGVPLLDRDWNELEDIRRYFEWALRRHYIGDGAPDEDGLRVVAPSFAAPRDVVVRAGRYCVGGYDTWLDEDVLLSELRDGELLPETPAGGDELLVYVEPRVTRVTAEDDPALGNPQDINIETCVRDRLDRVFGVLGPRDPLPRGAALLARIRRPAGATEIRAEMIEDLRTTGVSLAATARDFRRFRRDTLEALQQALEAIERIEHDLATLLWVVDVSASATSAMFGDMVRVTVSVRNRRNEPIRGASVSFSADWGSVQPSRATTDGNGQVSVELVGVATEEHPSRGHLGLLSNAASRVKQARERTAGAIDYSRIKFEPGEMAAVSRYLPPQTLVDLAPDVPLRPLTSPPWHRTATLTVHATESGGTIVRGSGSVQVGFSLWVRPWMLDSIREAISGVSVDARVAGAIRAGIDNGRLKEEVVVSKLPRIIQDLQVETDDAVKRSVFVDPNPPRDLVQGVGRLGQSIAQEAAAAVGAQVDRAIARQVDQLVVSSDVEFGAADAARAQVALGQSAATLTAGHAQQIKQRYNASAAVGQR